MLIRIVRMHFTEAGVEEFLEIFNAHKTAIRNFPGCSHLQLLKDAEDPNCYTTLSHWDKAESLEAYRKSELFGKVWGRVKKLFSERTQAISLDKFIDVNA
ncbi:MAG: putative quinol monooxygenase [Bacteroidota bacterium]